MRLPKKSLTLCDLPDEPSMKTNTAQRIEFAFAIEAISHRAGEAIMEVNDTAKVGAECKTDGSPVTKADCLADAIIVDGLEQLGWWVQIVSEERSKSHSSAAPNAFLLVDLLDCTKEFLKRDGMGGFAVNIAYIEDGDFSLV